MSSTTRYQSSATASTPSISSTELVRALMAFGGEEVATSTDADGEEEEVTVGGVRSVTRLPAAVVASKVLEKAGKRAGKGKEVGVELGGLSLESSVPAPAPTAPKSVKGLMRTSTHVIAMDGPEGKVERTLTSWKMADYAYKRDPCPFPTRARGLFTEEVEGKNGEKEYEIIARGYDKFFNVDEVSWTKWDAIPKFSTAPYELTQKSNGCIILIAALSPTHVLVTSKHSLGPTTFSTTAVSHSEKGEEWLDIHLARVGRRKEDLAKELWERNLTAVAELCDDAFEEHVLAYPSHLTGLHLHGLNHNTPILKTLSSDLVTSFALTWGLISTPFLIFPSVPSLRTYCSNVESAGGIEDPSTGKIIPIEGFVVRGHKRGGEEGEAFFWKVKYEEPYLMYREWRELTRRLLASYPEMEEIKPSKLRNEESRLYLFWVHREIKRDVSKFEEWKKGKGVVKTREEFLEWRKGMEARETQVGMGIRMKEDEERELGEFDRTLLVPIAVQGCGKTALGIALSELFGVSHTQSDDLLMKKPGPHFIKSVKSLLVPNSIVFADKNNHRAQLRSDLIAAAASVKLPSRVRTIALVWPIDSPTLPRDALHALCTTRIVQRGANHQTLRAGEGHEGAIWQFLGQYEPFDQAMNSGDMKFDEVVEMRAEWSREDALLVVVDHLVRILGLPRPSQESIERAIQKGKDYRPVVMKEAVEKKVAKVGVPRYFGVKVERDLKSLLDPLFSSNEPDAFLFIKLQSLYRVEPNPHITLVHSAELVPTPSPTPLELELQATRQALWDYFTTLTLDPLSPLLEVTLTLGPKIVWDDRAMAIEVSSLSSPSSSLPAALGKFHAHITVGTIENSVRPIEGKWLFEAVARGEEESKEGGRIRVRTMECRECKGVIAGLR